jgi:Flp pilus assembly protein TadG
VFLFLMFATIDFGRLMFTQTTLQHAMREGGRYGVTGDRLPSPDNPSSLQSRLDSIRSVVHKAATGVNIDPVGITISSARGGASNAGGPGDTLTIAMDYRFVFITPIVGQFFEDGAYTIRVSTSFRNEPFPPPRTAP